MATSRLATIPTPMAGLALGIASLGGCWEFSGLTSGQGEDCRGADCGLSPHHACTALRAPSRNPAG